MRNGNWKSPPRQTTRRATSSYRTYEEWKLSINSSSRTNSFSSYRTYEEWKPLPSMAVGYMYDSSYRTYEEWKPSLQTVGLTTLCAFLPYLWGMETKNVYNLVHKFPFGSYRTYEEWKLAACHSANSFINSSYRTYEEWKHRTVIYIWNIIKRFLPYLWGMETSMIWANALQKKAFLPYLWGMETQNRWCIEGSRWLSSYRTYEEWKPGW